MPKFDPLSREQILSLSGAALDEAVAERCFGRDPKEPWFLDQEIMLQPEDWQPSSSPVTREMVIEWITAHSVGGYYSSRCYHGIWTVRADDRASEVYLKATGESLGDAVCRCALLLAEAKREAAKSSQA
jgi:hypothetical protein